MAAAERVFYRHGVGATALTHIAKEANVTRGAIYWHFKNKQDLFEAMMCRRQLPMEVLLEEVRIADGYLALPKLHQHLVGTLQQAVTDQEHQYFYATVLHKCEINADNALLLDRQQKIFKATGAKIALILELAVKAGELPPALNVKKAVPFLQSSMIGLLCRWLMSPDSFDLYQYADGYVATLLNGLKFSSAFHKFNEEKV